MPSPGTLRDEPISWLAVDRLGRVSGLRPDVGMPCSLYCVKPLLKPLLDRFGLTFSEGLK